MNRIKFHVKKGDNVEVISGLPWFEREDSSSVTEEATGAD